MKKEVGIDIYFPFNKRRKKKFVVSTRRKITRVYKGKHPSHILQEFIKGNHWRVDVRIRGV